MKSLLLGLTLLLATTARAEPADDWLRQHRPALAQLSQTYAAYVVPMTRYAEAQGFRRPVARQATVLHELIHIASAQRRGYFVDGSYLEPYLRPSAWPLLRNRDIRARLAAGEGGIIASGYLPSTPDNGLANVLDEINAYSQVLPLVCALEPDSAPAQAERLIGHMQVLEAYLRSARSEFPRQYEALRQQPASVAALARISARARQELRACGQADTEIPGAELARLLSLAQQEVFLPTPGRSAR